eukprot:4765952-Lingulodinium_polyedra.AAC.1
MANRTWRPRSPPKSVVVVVRHPNRPMPTPPMMKTGRALVVETMACSCVAVPSPSRVPSWAPGR